MSPNDTTPIKLTAHLVPIPPTHQPIFDRAIKLLAGLVRQQRAKEKQAQTDTAHTATVTDYPTL